MSHLANDEPVGLVGAGTIGGGWAATYLARRRPVLVADPAPAALGRLTSYLDAVWPSVRRTVPGAPASPPLDLLRLVPAAELGAAALVHENVPESLEAKREAYLSIEASVASEVPILSSSGGLMPSDLQTGMKHPERLLVAHPQSPVYALPLVEVLAGEATSSAVVTAALAHLRDLGKRPVLLQREVPGYLTNRLTFAMLREAVHLLAEGVVDARGIEDAVVHGITPRFLVGGPLTSLALAGGPDGMRGAMRSFAETIEGWWSELGSPHLDEKTRALLIAAGDDVLDGRPIGAVLADRDAAAVDVLALLHADDRGQAEPGPEPGA
ncbi:3-hydroxyacyl-CoA dehydrogenase NAD-binding domain-containing protein [Actinomadura madurae]|uniref:3-hydroxyacyl-CoA dehydrogenase NAD-binding domain-containing protein n=1 Tax=Actinomadura madurae TaxID=1993 RepID=UPI002025DBE9|nr:3-hydroxyacyl-CoA dehydrogenase NAD-binding domain-containing protein [Actinomadura madurae]MCP9955611.1 3-hydroxyacyl-CoA dehydrogenase NAD-binding domain-containing protein [Actinomadura madurae]MCP9972345.1 3-hydroxyacyl-CoA dehydrogenase NAD-binding domain-containing protein [Actinomadura madurae]MCP9984857.1 3-hydroxyacyl-CoA dehydrogenase NAD-binding domain-containing protein [Actinomadura madurae]MCQ0003595.1 3-hydroxyacyl-CoA dehydrogenase NAD-binding domain-containing protein [Actin